MEMTDEVVIGRIQMGDIDFFSFLVKKYSKKIQSFVTSKLFKKEEADDIVQTSFIQLYKSLSRFDKKKPIYPYLMQITRNELYMYFRKNKKTVSLNDEVEHVKEVDEYNGDREELLTGLHAEQKNALLWFLDGYSYKDISKRLNKPLNTVRTIIRRARLFVKKNTSYEKK